MTRHIELWNPTFNGHSQQQPSLGSCFTHLLYQNDKTVFRSADRASGVIYASIAGKDVALGDPFGEPAAGIAALAEFASSRRAMGRGCLFYQLSGFYAEQLSANGWRTMKTGEEAFVDLPSFHTNGKAWLKLRTKQNKLHRDGYRCEVVQPADVDAALIAEMKTVSDAWLAGRKEKAFSVGSFSDEAAAGRHAALLRSPEDKLMAFVTLPEYIGADGRLRLTADLMRYDPSCPPGAMETLFLHSFAWARDRGYESCSLGVAPLANASRPWYVKLAASILSRQYNFEGLRHFKAKFRPEWQDRYLVYDGCPYWLALCFIARLVHRRTPKGRTAASGFPSSVHAADTMLRDSQ